MGRNKWLVILAFIIFALFVHVIIRKYYERVHFSMETAKDSTYDINEQRLDIHEEKNFGKSKLKGSEWHNMTAKMTRHYVLRDELKTFDPFTLKTPLPFLPEYKNPCFKDEVGKLYCLPYFFILAVQKSGTSDLHKKLVRHPMISSNKKEYHWWNRARFRSYPGRPRRNFTEYMDWYNSSTKEMQEFIVENEESQYHPMIIGDGTASSLYDQLEWRNIPENSGLSQPAVLSADVIKYVLPKAKFIVILRNPTDRLYSDYNFFNRRNQNRSSKAFDQKVREGILWFQECLSRNVQSKKSCLYDVPQYVNTSNKMWHPEDVWDPVVRLRAGLYSEFLSDWFNVFPRNQFYVVTLDQFSKNTVTELENMYKFLELPKIDHNFIKTDANKTFMRTNEKFKVPFWNDTKQLVNEFYQPYNIKVSKLLGAAKILWVEI